MRTASINPKTGRPGPAAKPGRDGDKLQARARVNQAVKFGRLPHPNKMPCTDCGHIYVAGRKPRHEYDHHRGYEARHHLSVEAVCTPCHVIRDNRKKAQTHCHKGHALDGRNTIIAKNGTRHCRECRREHDRIKRRRPPNYWRDYNRKRRERANG